MSPEPLAERIARYVARPDPDSFDDLAMAAFSALCKRDRDFRELCERAGASPGRIGSWRSVPAVRPEIPPAGDPGESVRLWAAAAVMAFRHGCLAGLDSPPILQLAPGDEPTALRERCGGPGSSTAAEPDRIGVGAARSWLAARQRDGRAAVVLAPPSALERLIHALERQDLRFRLAYGSRIVLLAEAGDPPSAADAGALGRRSAERLGVAPDGVRRQLRWPGVPTPLYGAPAADGGLAGAEPAPWMRVRALDPSTLDEAPEGETGILAALDLTILGRPFHLLTPTRGAVSGGAVRILGPRLREPAPGGDAS